MRNVVILGAGISGLSLGWYLKQRFGSKLSLKILEKNDRPGGWIESVRQEGFLFELGPRSCRAGGSGIETLHLIQQLKMEKEVIVANPTSRDRYLWHNKKLCRLPKGPLSYLSSPLKQGVLQGCIRDLLTPPSTDQDESIQEFICRRFGTKIAENLVDPLVKGIYAGDIAKLSVRSCFPALYQYEREHGSVIMGAINRRRDRKYSSSKFIQDIQKGKLFSFKGGMEDIILRLSAELSEHIAYSSPVTGISNTSQTTRLAIENGEAIETDCLVSTIPSHALAPLFQHSHSELARQLKGIPAETVVVVTLGYHKKLLRKNGFGYLVPSKENEQILGIVWDSNVFPQQNQTPNETRLTVMIGIPGMQNPIDYSEMEFLRLALSAIDRHLNIDDTPHTYLVRIASQAIPQYHLGHALRLAHIEDLLSQDFPDITLHGNSFYGISVNDCIANSKLIEEKFQQFP